MRNYPDIKMIVSDIDGTLVPKGDHISEQLVRTIHQLKERQIIFTLATGRSWNQTRHLAEALEVKVPVVVQSGALVIEPDTGAVLKSTLIDQKIAEHLWQTDTFGLDWFHLSLQGIYSAVKIQTREGARLQSYLGEHCSIVTSGRMIPEDNTVKFLGVGRRCAVKRLQQSIRHLFPDGRQIVWPGRHKDDGWYIEIFAPMADKAYAVESVAHRLNVSMAEVMAFGDGDNDFELIAKAGLGCAIKTAPRYIRRHAKIIADDPQHDGVANALNRWVLEPEEDVRCKKWFSTFIPTRF